jgi:annexin A7/11
MRDGLYYIARGAETSQAIERDVEFLYEAMAGMGTKDERLVYRVVRGHWCKPRWEDVKRVYKAKYGKSLSSAIKGETSGKYEVSPRCFVGGSELTSNHQRMLVAMCE